MWALHALFILLSSRNCIPAGVSSIVIELKNRSVEKAYQSIGFHSIRAPVVAVESRGLWVPELFGSQLPIRFSVLFGSFWCGIFGLWTYL